MKFTLKAGLALTAVTGAVAISGTSFAADLGGDRAGSMKDSGFYEPMPQLARASGPCYFRADVGYAHSNSPSASWPVNNRVGTDANGNGVFDYGEIASVFVGDSVSNAELDSTWFGEAGAGCGLGMGEPGRGFRGELMLGVHGERDFTGEPMTYIQGPNIGDPVPGYVPNPVDDPMHTSIRSYTAMINIYRDLGQFGRMTPYVGAGIGAAYHIVDETYFTGNTALVNRIAGEEELSFAWSAMAGIGFQISDRAIIDVGYRYLDLGSAETGRVDSAGFVNPRVNIEDITEHQIKVGLRYAFGGGGDCCAPAYAPMK